MRRLVLVLALGALLAPASAAPARFAVGAERGVAVRTLAARIERAGWHPVSTELAALRALVVEASGPRGLRRIPGVAYVEDLRPRRRISFRPQDPFAPRQWYLARSRAFDFWSTLPALASVRVAVIDSGVDGRHPELRGRVTAAKSFVGGSPYFDRIGHGTFVAGLIAARTDNDIGIAGIAFSSRLLVAKVVRPDGSISAEAEARAIKWAADRGARVINMSLGGVRDPFDPSRDTYSPLEQAALEYAYRRGAVLVAAAGNSDQAPRTPWNYASYPAALPHVIGVGALARDGSVPAFSHRDPVFVDIAAPGEGIVSTVPRALTALDPSCREQGYSPCGPPDYRRGEGTSFAAPQVAAAAALLIATRPELRPEQVTALLEHAAVDVNGRTGCRRCPVRRDRLTGWGRLDIAASLRALADPLPPRDNYEPNDDGVARARPLYGARTRTVAATIDFWNDRVDVYEIYLRQGQKFFAAVRGPGGAGASLRLSRPGGDRLEAARSRRPRPGRTELSARAGVAAALVYRASAAGWHALQVTASTPGSGRYTLAFSKTAPRVPPPRG